MKKEITIIGLSFLCLLAFCKQQNEFYIPEGVINARSGPGINSKKVFKLNTDDVVTEIKRQDKKVKIGKWEGYWVNIDFNGKKGWVLSVFIKPKINSNSLSKDKREELTEKLIKAIRMKNLKTVKKLINQGASVNEADYQGFTPLLNAVMIGDYRIIDYLLLSDADPNKGKHSNIDGKKITNAFPIVTAAENGKFKIIKRLIKSGANVNVKVEGDFTALISICLIPRDAGPIISRNTRFKIAKLLVESGADINIKNMHGKTAIDMAKKNGLRKIASFLIKAKK